MTVGQMKLSLNILGCRGQAEVCRWKCAIMRVKATGVELSGFIKPGLMY